MTHRLISIDMFGRSVCFPPAGKIPVHQSVKPCVVRGLYQVAKLMYHHVFYAPFGQEQQVDGEAYGACPHVAYTPPGDHLLVRHGRHRYAHLCGVPCYHRLHQFIQPPYCFLLVRTALQRQLRKERRTLVFALYGSHLSPLYPCAMCIDECFYMCTRHPYRCRHMYVTVLYHPHRQSRCPPVRNLNHCLSPA